MGLPRSLLAVVLFTVACGGGHKAPKKPVEKPVVEAPPPKETEADREKKRHAQALTIVPEGSTCLPTALKEENAPRLELAANGADAIVCAIDQDSSRYLGPVGCWKVDVSNGALTYQEATPLPGRGMPVKLDDGCARGYCLPKDAKGPETAMIAWNLDGSKVAVVAGDQVHLFDAASKEHGSSFSIRGDKGVNGDVQSIAFVGDAILVQAGDQVGVFKTDGTAVGPIAALGGKKEEPASTKKGSMSVLDKTSVGLADKGWETLTVYEVDTGKRSKLVRKVGKAACKPAEVEAYWNDGDKVTDKCKDSMNKLSGHLVGATAVKGKTNFLVLLRGDRLGELAVLDAKTLAEKKAIKMPWCTASADGAAPAASDEKAEEKAEKPADKKTRGPEKKAAGKTSDPEEGGE